MTTNTDSDTAQKPVLVAPRRILLPDHYASVMSSNQKLDIAAAAADYVSRSLGLSPIAASVTGSRLRGTDTAESDTDVLVLVSDKVRARTIRPRTLAGVAGVEGQIQSVSSYASLLATSVPYVEFQRSPFMLTHCAYRPFLTALRPSRDVLSVHAQRFVRHLYARLSLSDDKRLRTAAAVHHLVHTGSPLCPREYTRPETVPDTVLEWIAHALDRPTG